MLRSTHTIISGKEAAMVRSMALQSARHCLNNPKANKTDNKKVVVKEHNITITW